ncbi:dCMP deaminase family protein [Aneurinibacillus thermoaerophilus]|uniref:deoxycytidylate deaminase n=1 Tax=Aneurinibacillus thermoaerophilus TaxID=143495 RepID=UPI002E20B0A7|nr:dCMP deaminase family protein [Aneurinibacillus thermoaerophilus]MED0763957.1 dCMP deaminase family protein [Aneurinibacillus thermoaerophilus]
MSPRKTWDEYFMDLAYMAATRATCPRRHVGAVLTKNKKVLGTAYNGSPSGVESCLDVGCMLHTYYEVDEQGNSVEKQKCIRTIHAEQNLLLFTDQEERQGATIYVTDQPCWMCANLIANSGIIEVVYHRIYLKDYEKVAHLFEQKQIMFRQLLEYTPPAGGQIEIVD